MSDLLKEIHDSVGVITLNRPAALNAVTHEMWHELKVACEEMATESRRTRQSFDNHARP